MANPRGGRGVADGLVPPPATFYVVVCVFYKKLSLVLRAKNYYLENEYEICFKMIEISILETQIFKISWGRACPQIP